MEAKALMLQVTITSLAMQQCFVAEWLELEAPNGCFVICPGHINLASKLKSGSVVAFKNHTGLISTFTLNGPGVVNVYNGVDVQILIFDN